MKVHVLHENPDWFVPVGKALDAVAREWERTHPVPPPVIWERKLQDIRTLAVATLEYLEQSLAGQRSWAEIPWRI